MERIQSINPARIEWCCADQGTTLDELASELSIAKPTLDRVMSGQGGMTFNQLSKLAARFGRGVLFFLDQGPVDERSVHTPAFRTLANQKPQLTPKIKALIERVEKQRDVYVSLREDLDDELAQSFQPPMLPPEDVRRAASIAREWLNLKVENRFETYRAAVEARGILVFRSNGYNGKWQIARESPILGFSLYDQACPVIVIKKLATDTQQAFTLMHELAHLLLHKSSSIDDESDMYSRQGHEREANAFAGYLLVPAVLLDQIRPEDRPNDVARFDDWLQRLRRAWGVSTEVILRRLLDEGKLPQDEYEGYRRWRDAQVIPVLEGGTRMYRHREPTHLFGDRFVRTVLDALDGRHITLAKASSYLDGLKINDLHQLERHYAGV